MFIHYKNIPINLNGNSFVVNDLRLSQEVELVYPYRVKERVSERNIPNGPYIGNLSLKYYLTGSDYLKNYIYSDENQTLTGNIAGLIFRQGFLNNYTISCTPNNPIEVDANIIFFDKISGTLAASSSRANTGIILRFSDVVLNNLSTYTKNWTNNILKADFNYNGNVTPSYTYVDTGSAPQSADKVNIQERKISVEIASDSTNMDLPLSGEDYGVTLVFQNPFNNSIYETFGCSGKINAKQLNVSTNNFHTHSIRLTQNHLNNVGGISGVVIGTGIFTIYSTPNSHPFTSPINEVQYITEIDVGDTVCTGYTISNQGSYDKIVVPIPADITNDILKIFSTKGNYIWPYVLNFTYPSISITGVSAYSGFAGTPIYISGDNFYRISRIMFGGVNAHFKTITPQLILATIPINGISSKINVVSDLRNLTGLTPNVFFCQPQITNFTPLTGVWMYPILIQGSNFTGVTGVYFNGVFASGFTILSNNFISAYAPRTGAGYTHGYVTVSGSGGFSQSASKYEPQIPIYGLNATVFNFGDPIIIQTTVDTDYLFPYQGGYKVRLGGLVTSVTKTSSTTLQGTIPVGAKTDYIYIYKVDDESSVYTPTLFGGTGGGGDGVITIQSQPKIYSVTPATINQYKSFNLAINGDNFNYFQGLPFYVALSGGNPLCVQKYSNILVNSGANSDTILLSNISITGSTGNYTLIVQNLGGMDSMAKALFVKTGVNLAQQATASIPNGGFLGTSYQAAYAIDNSMTTFAALKQLDGLWITFKNNNVNNVSYIKAFIVNPGSSIYDSTLKGGGYTGPFSAAYSGAISGFYKGSTKPAFGCPPSDMSTGYIFDFSSNPQTGIAQIRFYSKVGASTNYIGIKEIQIY